MNIFLFIGAIFIATLFLGRYLEKIRVPWIFAALIIGAGLATYNPFGNIIESETFETFAKLGMYFLLFLVGFELNIEKLKKKSGFIFRSAFFIIFLEGLLASLVVHFAFGYDWIVSLLVAMSFATVGEAILVPILQEFKLINTPLGQSIIGIGTADDIIEILLLIFASILVGTQAAQDSIFLILGSLAILILLTASFSLFKKKREKFKFANIETLFLFILFVFFVFIGVGEYAELAPLGAILAGISIRLFIHNERLEFVENELKSWSYGFFAPLFFVWAGATLNIKYLSSLPLLILLVAGVSIGAKLFGSYIVGRKEIGTKGSILLGIGLSVRFSTSIIIIKFLFDNGIVNSDIYSVVVASSIIFMFIVPVLFSNLVTRWKFVPTS